MLHAGFCPHRIRVLTNTENERLEESISEHLEIIGYLLKEDIAAAAEAMGRHYFNSKANIMKFNNATDLLKRWSFLGQ